MYRRVDWRWAQNGEATVSHGWKPETGFLRYRWEGYNEALILYVLGLGSPTHPLPEKSYLAWTSTYRWKKLYGHEFLYGAPLFMHQLSHLWIDFRGIQDAFMRRQAIDYFENSRRATYVNQQYAIRNPKGFRDYGQHAWGITASNGPGPTTRRVRGVTRRFLGYVARGVPNGPDDGTLAPWAVVASLPFAPEIVLPTLEHCSKTYPNMENEYGLVCSFNPTFPSRGSGGSGWISKDHFALDQGPVILMIENYRSGLIWRLMRSCPEVAWGCAVRGLGAAGCSPPRGSLYGFIFNLLQIRRRVTVGWPPGNANMRRSSRRDFLATSSLSLGAASLIRLTGVAQSRPEENAVFRHGVASGDPLADRVILWTRVTTGAAEWADVRWTVATDPGMSRIVARGEGRTGVVRDFTVKVDVTGLTPATTYYFRFEAEGARSAIGRTRTLPRGATSHVRLGVVSCSNYPFGYFNAYAALAARTDLDAVIHLGDYIYEYANATYGDGTPYGRIAAPNKEMVALADYRERHAQYKADPDAREVHRQHPFIVVWDDHELTNNAWREGAENHNPDQGEGDWFVRTRRGGSGLLRVDADS